MENKIELITRDSLNKSLENKQDKISPGRGVTISDSNEISFDINEATRYSAGENIFIDSENRIHARFNIPQPDGDQLPPSIPPAELEAPNPIMNFRAEFNSDRIVLNWDLPEDDKLAGVKIIRNNYKYPTSINDGYGVYEGKDNTFTDMEIKNSGSVYYRAFTFNRRKVFNPDATQITKVLIRIKAETPKAPIIDTIDETGVTIKPIPNGEYKIGEHGSWQSENIFTGLQKKTSYTVYQRHAETEEFLPSDVSQGTIFTTKELFLFTVKIDLNNSHPENCCTYADDLIDILPESEIIDQKLGYYPCLVKNGVETVKLNPNNYKQTIDGREIDITSGNNGDVMIAFPRLAYKAIREGSTLTVSITNEDKPNNISDFIYTAFENEDSQLSNKLYFSAYPLVQNSDNSTWGSISGFKIDFPSDQYDPNFSVNTQVQYLYSKSQKYQVMTYFQLVFLQCLMIIRYKRLDFQHFAPGIRDAKNNYVSGQLDDKGLNYKSSTNEGHKFFGMEYMFGNVHIFLEGICAEYRTDRGLYITKKREKYPRLNIYNDYDGSRLKSEGWNLSDLSFNNQFGSIVYINKVIGNNILSFLPNMNMQDRSGSFNKHFCAGFSISSGYFSLSGRSTEIENNIFTVISCSENNRGYCRFTLRS